MGWAEIRSDAGLNGLVVILDVKGERDGGCYTYGPYSKELAHRCTCTGFGVIQQTKGEAKNEVKSELLVAKASSS